MPKHTSWTNVPKRLAIDKGIQTLRRDASRRETTTTNTTTASPMQIPIPNVSAADADLSLESTYTASTKVTM
jgi:hypothetical protein